MLVFLLFCAHAFLATSLSGILCEATFAPVIIIPGDGASPIDAKVTGRNNCHGTADWYRLWPNIKDILFGKFSCSVANMALIFDPATNKSHTPSTVQTRVPGWGKARAVEYIVDNFFANLFRQNYDAENLVRAMESWGYRKDVSIRGAPYDFRFAMASVPEYFKRLKLLVHDTWLTNHKRKVALISHSMGGIFATWFLNSQPQEWKDKYIHAFIPLSTPWGGSTKALHCLTSGYNFHIPMLKPITLRKLEWTFESNYLLLPNYRFQPPGHVFVYTDTHNFTLTPKDINLFFKLTKNKLGPLIYNKVIRENEFPNWFQKSAMSPHPAVPTYCFYGVGILTEGQYFYPKGTFPDSQPITKGTSGDGTVVRRSLRGCKIWERDRHTKYHNSKFYAEAIEIPGVSHMGVFSCPKILAKMKKILWIEK